MGQKKTTIHAVKCNLDEKLDQRLVSQMELNKIGILKRETCKSETCISASEGVQKQASPQGSAL